VNAVLRPVRFTATQMREIVRDLDAAREAADRRAQVLRLQNMQAAHRCQLFGSRITFGAALVAHALDIARDEDAT
jgi:hypothetical protein